MLTFVFFVVIMAGVFGTLWIKAGDRTFSYSGTTHRQWIAIWVTIISCVYLVFAGIWVGVQYDHATRVNNSQYVLDELVRQRDVAAAILEDKLSTEEFAMLLEADTPEDISWLAQNAEVSQFMLARADRVVGINAELFRERNQLLAEARTVCNYTDNPLIPKIPFVSPDCKLASLQEIYASSDS